MKNPSTIWPIIVKVEVKDLQSAAYAANSGSDDLGGKTVDFTFNCGKDGEQKNYAIRVIGKAGE